MDASMNLAIMGWTAPLPPLPPLVARPSFLRVWTAYRSLTEAERDAGRRWYVNERHALAYRADAYGLPERIVIEAAAALSAGLRWDRSLSLLDRLLVAQAIGAPMPTGGDATFGMRPRKQAWEILHGRARCRGAKVKPFADALDGDTDAVVVDRHMVRIATGTDVRQLHPAAMDRIAASIRVVAWSQRERPAHVQAALWSAKTA